jgi:UDP-N-acetylmuramoyl-tripeptide--D-alanyl-D-alanine ligase
VKIEALYKIFQQYPSIQTDTRKLKKDDLYFALKGPNFNGNLFAKQAIESGAAYAIVDENIDEKNKKIILVEDVLTALQNLAKFHREQFNIPFIAITGSNGKTTTKELIHAALSSYFKTYTTEGNLNNHIGIPLTILKIKSDAQIAVIEMGANHQKEIEGYCVYAQPTHGIITNCGKAHLEGFGGVEGVRKGKGELFDFIRVHNGIAFAFDDYNYLHEMSKGIKQTIWYGTETGNIAGNIKTISPFLEVGFTKGVSLHSVQTQLVGAYNLPNILCAVCVAKYFNVPEEKIKTAIENYSPSNSRSQLVEKDSNKIILDAYNANPTSMKAAIENFAAIDSPQKILLLGGMMELGNESIAEHQNIINIIDQYQWKDVVLVGVDFDKIKHSYHYFNNAAEAKIWLDEQHFQNAYLLIKGSRSMAMEKIL